MLYILVFFILRFPGIKNWDYGIETAELGIKAYNANN